MRLTPTPAEQEFRERAAEWLSRNVPRDARPHAAGDAMRDFDVAWQRTQNEGGWAGVSWPEEFGGAGLSLAEQVIWYEQSAIFDAPSPGVFSIALGHAGPTIISAGTQQQKVDYLRPILTGDHIWAQGFSETGSGSDLASLQTRAVVDGDDLVINGSKIWTTYGYLATHQELLVRTDPDVPKHKGLSFLVLDLATPGIEIQPIDTIDSDRHFSQVFYDDVRVPLANVIGGLGGGWRTALTTLGFERGTMSIGEVVRLQRLVDRLWESAATQTDARGRAITSNERVVAELADIEAQASALYAFANAFVSRTLRTGEEGSDGSMIRLFMAELLQRIKRTAVDLLGRDGLTHDGTDAAASVVGPYFYSFAHTIGGGTAEVQRNIIAERVLGLPRG